MSNMIYTWVHNSLSPTLTSELCTLLWDACSYCSALLLSMLILCVKDAVAVCEKRMPGLGVVSVLNAGSQSKWDSEASLGVMACLKQLLDSIWLKCSEVFFCDQCLDFNQTLLLVCVSHKIELCACLCVCACMCAYVVHLFRETVIYILEWHKFFNLFCHSCGATWRRWRCRCICWSRYSSTLYFCQPVCSRMLYFCWLC